MSAQKGKTLFSYFQKSPTSRPRSVLTPSKEDHSNANSVKKQNKLKENDVKIEKNCSKSLNVSKDSDFSDSVFAIYDIVWAKVEGYPWWPGLICQSPEIKDKGSYFIPEEKGGPKYHIQFFDDPPTRAWVKVRAIKVFTGPKTHEIPSQKDLKWKASVERATEAYQKTVNDRKTLVAIVDQEDETEELEKDEVENVHEDSDNEEIDRKRTSDTEIAGVSKRRRIITVLSDDDDDSDEYVPDKKELNDESDNHLSDVVDSEEESPVKKTPASKTKAKSKKSTLKSLNIDSLRKKISESSPLSDSTRSKLSQFTPTEDQDRNEDDDTGAGANEERNWIHLTSKFDFLTEKKRKDGNGRTMSHPDYNPRTLYVPESFIKTVSPGHKQWWEIKSKNFDVVIFFKVGKFYELYHMDAVIGVNELGLSYMKGEYAHSGFPEKSYGHFSGLLLQKGYKVGRVEQTETPAMMEERCKNVRRPTKDDKVITRELCRVTTKGTRTYSFLEGESNDANNCFLLALTENVDCSTGVNFYGVCFIDTSIGTFHIGQFSDDRNCSRLRTLIAHYPPTQVLYEKHMLSSKTLNILENCLSYAMKEPLRSGYEFLEATDTLKLLETGKYFASEKSMNSKWPEVLLKFIDPNDQLRQTVKDGYELAIKCLGACVWYLKYSRIDDEILTMKKFEEYIPPDENVRKNINTESQFSRCMVLDGATLLNLEVIEAEDGSSEGTLLETMDYCSTPFGKRLFRQWICAPLCKPRSIEYRQMAIEDLRSNPNLIEEIVPLLKQLPDLQRLLSKIHTQGLARRNRNHADSRAVFYEETIYSRKKIADFLLTLEGFQSCLNITEIIRDSKDKLNSKLLKKCVVFEGNGGSFPLIKSLLKFFENAFDHEKAKKDGKIIPCSGVDKEYDSAKAKIEKINSELDHYLITQRKHFGCNVSYFGTGKNRFQLEVPDNASKKATKEHDLQGQRKGYKRFMTKEIQELFQELTTAEDHMESALRDIMRRIFAAFDKDIDRWEAAIECISALDVLTSMAQYSLNTGVEMCKPQIEYPKENDVPFLKICEGRHPALLKLFKDDDLVANDIEIGTNGDDVSQKSNLLLITGPNMGGKSTLMREAGLIVIMAQMGSFVPAESCRFTVVDRIFTRLGANDQIMDGESTFFVELSETVSILRHATKNSLILMDELGRGTATFDGSAIAYSVVRELSTNITCRSLFSTHYHNLVEEFTGNPKVQQGHMACMVENDSEDPDQETITFLYKFVDGSCPKSYGFNAAKLAGIPDTVIKTGRTKAKEFEESLNQIKVFRTILEGSSEIRSIVSSFDRKRVQ